MNENLDKLERIERLHASGGLTDAEFAAEKQRLLSQGQIDPHQWARPNWRSLGLFCAALFVIGAVGIAILLLMPEPGRDADVAIDTGAASPPSEPTTPSSTDEPTGVPSTPPQASAAPAAELTRSGATELKPVRGRCLLQVNGKNYIDGDCDIVLEQDGSFDIQDRLGNPTYFAKVLRDGAEAQGYWNQYPGATRAHTDLGPLKRAGACWMNSTARICAWR